MRPAADRRQVRRRQPGGGGGAAGADGGLTRWTWSDRAAPNSVNRPIVEPAGASNMKATGSIEATLPLIRAGLYAMLADEDRGAEGGAGTLVTPGPFVTVSRQAGAGGRTFAQSLAERLNAAGPVDRPWAVWD